MSLLKVIFGSVLVVVLVVGGIAATAIASHSFNIPGVSSSPAPSGNPGKGAGAIQDVLNQLVSEGKITQDQANLILGRLDYSRLTRCFGLDANGLADKLGMTPEQVAQEWQSGKSLTEIAAGAPKPMTKDQLVAYITDSIKAKLDQAVKDQNLTQKREDEMIQKITANLPNILDAKITDVKKGFGGRGFGGRGHGWGMGRGFGPLGGPGGSNPSSGNPT